MYKAESCSGGDTQQPVSANQNPPSKSLMASFNESFISSGKQGSGATVLREGHDIIIRETCVLTSFSECKQLWKNSCAASCLGFS
jgi:hypothetical protein